MKRTICQSLGFRLACAGTALLLTSSMAIAQGSGEGEDPISRPAATAPPSATPAPSAAPATAAPNTPATGGPKANGLVFQLKLGANLFGAMSGDVSATGSLAGGFMVGYKLGRLTLGLGIEASRLGISFGGPGDMESGTALLLFEPTVEYYLAISNPMVLYLVVGLHIGLVNNHQDPGEDTKDIGFGFLAGVGLRYFVHPRFAVGIEGGFRGIWVKVDNDPGDDDTVNIWTIYGAAVLTAIW